MVSSKFCASRIISFDFYMLSVCWSTQSKSVLSISVWTSRCSLFFIFGFPWKCYRVCNLLNVWCMLLNRITIAKWWRQIKPYRKSDYMDITDHMYIQYNQWQKAERMLLWQLKYTCWGFLEAFCEINKSHHKLKLKSKKHTERSLAVMLVSRASKKRLHSVSTTVYNLPIFRLRSLNRRETKLEWDLLKW